MVIHIKYECGTSSDDWDITTDYMQDGSTREYKLPDGGKLIVKLSK